MFLKNKTEKGFSYIDVMIGIVILMVGILAMLSALTANLMRSYESEKNTIAKQTALSMIESIISAKEIARPDELDNWDTMTDGWARIGNIGTNRFKGAFKGIFVNEWHPIRQDVGADGVAGTLDDACPAGSACVVGGKSNNSPIMKDYERLIVITDVADPERPSSAIARRRIEVSVRYRVNQAVRTTTVATLVANY